jgi:hypothetical protein
MSARVAFSEFRMTKGVPSIVRYVMAPIEKHQYTRAEYHGSVPYCLAQAAKVCHSCSRGICSIFPMKGSPMGPGGEDAAPKIPEREKNLAVRMPSRARTRIDAGESNSVKTMMKFRPLEGEIFRGNEGGGSR